MELILSFVLFMAVMIVCLSTGTSMVVALLVGLAAFGAVAFRRGFSAKDIAKMAIRGANNSMVVVLIMLLIGCLTALWRMSGTIAYFTYHGIRLIPPQIFILAAFFLAAVMSYLLGTSFGVAGTIGVILMTIARASGVNPLIAGGAILSGVYFGDRSSPAASSASLVANETRTDLNRNIRLILKTSVIPLILCTLIYAALSIGNRPAAIDTGLLTSFENEFTLSLWCLLPTVLLLVLAFAGMKIKYVMLVDIIVTIILTMLVQKAPLGDILHTMITGYTPSQQSLADILSGGGVFSMIEIMSLLLLSSACAGIFEGTRMLAYVEGTLKNLSGRIGRFPAMVITSFAVSAIFCNQTIGVIMCRQCMQKSYEDTEEGRMEMMMDIENSVILIAPMVPWNIACSVPQSALGLPAGAIFTTCYLYILPVCWFFEKKIANKRALRTKQA